MKEVNTPGLELIGDDEVHGVNESLMCKLITELQLIENHLKIIKRVYEKV